MKRFITLLLVAILVVTSMTIVAFAATETEKGAVLEIPVTVTGDDADGIGAFKVQLSNTDFLTIQSIRVDNPAATVNTNKKIVVWSAANNVSSFTFYVTVKVSANAEIGETYKLNAVMKDAAKKVPVSSDNDGVADGWMTITGNASASVKIICNHTFGEWTETVAPGCESKGEERRDCTKCDHYETREIAAAGHSYGNWYVSVAAGCESKGEERRDCANCNHYETREIAATGHSYGNWYVSVAAGCESKGEERRACANCDHYETREIAATGHAMGNWTVTVAAGCESKGEERRACANCDHYETREIAATGHTAGQAVRENVVAATCEEAGSYDEVVYCTVCDKELSRQNKTVSATGHTEGDVVRENEVAATCGADGSYDEVVYCTVCDKELSRVNKTIPATGEHVYGAGVVTKEATCTEDGVMTYTCACGHTKTEVIPAGHTWSEWIIVKDATCTEDGLKTRTCSKCGEVETEVIPSATAHVWGDWTVTKEATCTEDGQRTHTCSKCGKVMTEVIEALGHDWSEWKVTEDATCTENGKKTRKCAHCDKVETEVIKAEGHNYKNGVCTKCGHKDPNYQPPTEDGEKDDVPETGDITTSVFMTGALVLVLMAAAVAFVFKRRTVK